MDDSPPLEPGSCILQVNNYDIEGGAEMVSMNLFSRYQSRGYHSYLVVGTRRGSDPGVREITRGQAAGNWEQMWLTRSDRYRRAKETSALARYRYYSDRFLAHPINTLRVACGGIDYDFPSTGKLLTNIPEKPDIIHLHNIHGNFFDIRVLPTLTTEIPVVLSLHDTFYLCRSGASQNTGGHNERASAGIRSWPARYIRSGDEKRITGIFSRSWLFVACPSRWLMERMEKSPLGHHISGSTIIPNGVDLEIFRPCDRTQAREMLGLPAYHTILLFVSKTPRNNPDKDYATLSAAVHRMAKMVPDRKILFLVVGEDGPVERYDNLEFRPIPFIRDARILARYYQASDLYLHASVNEVWGLTVTEALACGIPVIATGVGGIPEQIREGFNGFLTRPHDADGMAEGIVRLLEDDALREEMGRNAADDARARFDLEVQVTRYLRWYHEVRKNWNTEFPAGTDRP